MGSEQSTLQKNGYIPEEESICHAVATKGDEKFFIIKISLKVRENMSQIQLNTFFGVL